MVEEDVQKTSLRQVDEDKTGYGSVVAETQIGSLPAGNHICNSGFQILVRGIRGTCVEGTFACLVDGREKSEIIGRYWQADADSTQGGLCLERCTRRRRVVARPESGMLIAEQCDVRYRNHDALVLEDDNRGVMRSQKTEGEKRAVDIDVRRIGVGRYLVGSITCRML